jgi:hypothetical protein
MANPGLQEQLDQRVRPDPREKWVNKVQLDLTDRMGIKDLLVVWGLLDQLDQKGKPVNWAQRDLLALQVQLVPRVLPVLLASLVQMAKQVLVVNPGKLEQMEQMAIKERRVPKVHKDLRAKLVPVDLLDK